VRFAARVPVTERSQAAEARRIAVDIADQAGFDEVRKGEIAIVVTEAGTNLAKHSSGGEVLLNVYEVLGAKRFEMVAVDHGPGMDLDLCRVDGFSTTATAGTGLGAIARLPAVFDAYSDAKGTVIFAGFDAYPGVGSRTLPLVVGSVRVPKNGETVCGDDWTMVRRGESVMVLVADGLGHGPFAAEAAAEAVNAIEGTSFASVVDAVNVIHGALRGTRGAAIAIAEITVSAAVSYCGLGNIAGALVSAAGVQHMVSHNGTAGHDAHRITSFQYSWPEEATMIMHSDGLITHWRLDRYPGLLGRHPSVIAGVLYRDYTRGRDDTTVVVLRRRQVAG
jgi:anti-sigma regulatory factor (Ser/Thr protein kinase)